MGVDLKTLIKKYSPDSIKKINYSDHSGEIWAIDASIFIYKFCYDPLSKGKNSHITQFYNLLRRLLNFNITPIVIFDGKVPELKLKLIEKRKKEKHEKMEKIKELEAKGEDVSVIKRQLITFSESVYDDIITVCNMLNVQSIRANYEADSLCIKLLKEHNINAIMSEDFDILMGGGKRMLCKFDYSDSITEINLDKVLIDLKITYEQFVEIAILIGTDYTEGKIMKGFGPIKSYQFILNGGHIPDEYNKVKDYIINAYKNEENISLIKSNDKAPIKWDELKTFLNEKCNTRETTVNNHQLEYEELHPSEKLKKLTKKIIIKLGGGTH